MTPALAFATPARFATQFYAGFQFPHHIQQFQRATVNLLTDPCCNRQIIEAPVRHGKSVWHSVIVPAWFCCVWPDRKVLGVSYGASLSDEFSREVLKIVSAAAPVFGLQLDPKHTRNDSFRWLGHSGGYDSCGAEGAVSGKGYHLIAADDLVKDDKAARSPTMRASLSKWFFADCLTRCEPDAKVSLVMSRRHIDDLSGQCLAMNAELPESLKWHSVQFKAIDDVGNALWPERYPIQKLRDIEREFEIRGMSYMFSALYQQNPRSDPAACEWPDSYFGRKIFYDELPPGLPVKLHVTSCDPSKGARSTAGDYCAMADVILDGHNHLWVDLSLRRMTTTEVIENYAAFIHQRKPRVASMETQGFQSQLAIDVRKRLDELGCITQLHPFDTNENKEVRIRMALSEWLHTGRLHIKDTLGGRLTVQQLQEFPSGQNDDGPDALAQALCLIGDMLL